MPHQPPAAPTSISALVEQLLALRDAHGDLPVVLLGYDPATPAIVAATAVLSRGEQPCVVLFHD